MPSAPPHSILILGSGPAGWTAAIYAARANRHPLVLRGPQPGGQLTTTTLVENFPGFPEGVDGNQLMAAMEDQARRVGAEVLDENVESVDFSGKMKKAVTDQGAHEAPVIIIATGATARRQDFPGERALFGHGISTCATCDGFFFRKKRVAVIGGGDSAMEEASYLANLAASVKVIHRRDALRASKIMQGRVLKNPKVEMIWNAVVTAAHGIEEKGHSRLAAVTLRDVNTNAERRLNLDGLFFAIGHDPNTSFLKGRVALDEQGYLIINERMETNVPGVYGAGDVADRRYRQAVTAAGMGCRAAMEAEKFLAEHSIK
jgi:thioredoxin reductase (NADPH)